MSLYESIFTLLEDIRQDAVDQYERLNLRASGDFDRKSKVGRRGRKVFLTFPIQSRFITNLKGRRPGRPQGKKQPPIPEIIQWMRDKRIAPRNASGQFVTRSERNYKQSAYRIARKIGEKGTDIWQGKRQAIDMDKIINNALDYNGEAMADRIIEQYRK